MIGAIIGDTIGSVYEFDNIKKKDFQPLFAEGANFTDDSIMSVAVADWLLHTDRSQAALEERLVSWAADYPCPMGGYGGTFDTWLFTPEYLTGYRDDAHPDYQQSGRHPYNSWGNGSAMRASACGWVASSLEEALDLGRRSAEITHNHPEGIKGAQAVAAAIYMALHGESKEAIRRYAERQFGYDLDHTCDEIRPAYGWDSSCQGTVPQAIIAFLDSETLEDAIRLAVSLGGDSDTLACITGGIAEAYYVRKADDGRSCITEEMQREMQQRLPGKMWDIIAEVRRG